MKGVMRLYFLFILFSLTACRAALSTEIQSTADHETLFEEILADPKEHIGKVILLGGEILRARTVGSKTEVEFAEIPLYKGTHPALGFDPGERFFVIFPERLDGVLFKKGKVMTLAGKVIGVRRMHGYDYPLLAHEESYLWNKLREDRFPSFGAFLGFS